MSSRPVAVTVGGAQFSLSRGCVANESGHPLMLKYDEKLL
jgi:hypothetical protein